jgi:hypothetical protein
MGATLDTAGIKKQHKFFDIFIDNDLNALSSHIVTIHNKIFDENILNVSDLKLLENGKKTGASTILGISNYNIFNFMSEEVYKLQVGLRKLMQDVCSYYELDFEKEKFLIHGWYNFDYSSNDNGIVGEVNPLKFPEHFHDHSGGFGSPWFHGYYCVNAEPSSTFYQIDRNSSNIFENINKNNRAIISETGHPHGRDDWYQKNPRITIAYDITPMQRVGHDMINKWIAL